MANNESVFLVWVFDLKAKVRCKTFVVKTNECDAAKQAIFDLFGETITDDPCELSSENTQTKTFIFNECFAADVIAQGVRV